MKVYIVYDKRTGEILHKHRLVTLEQKSDPEDSLECEHEQVLSSYRGSHVPMEHLGVAALDDYQPRSSRGRTSTYDQTKARIIDQITDSSTAASRSSAKKHGARAGKD